METASLLLKLALALFEAFRREGPGAMDKKLSDLLPAKLRVTVEKEAFLLKAKDQPIEIDAEDLILNPFDGVVDGE